MQHSFPYTINVDWLQVFCHDDNDGMLHVLYFNSSSYEFKLLPHSSRHFAEIWEVLTEDGDKYAVIQRKPHSSILSSDAAIVQLCNRELYKTHYALDFRLFLSAHGFRYKSISRLDVCFDSTCLRNGLTHSNLIKGIITGKYLKNNQSRVKWHFDAMATVGRPMECNSCSFGSQSSSVSSKMYNKSLEMRQEKSKPYIIENWEINGIDTSQDVWRIELSIKSDATNTIRTSTGEIYRLHSDSLELQTQVEDIFFSYAEKYFSFKRNDGKKNKTRMPNLDIFPKDRQTTLHPVRITGEKDSGRSDRIFLKRLIGLRKEWAKGDRDLYRSLGVVVNAFTLSRNLATWKAEHLGSIEDPKSWDTAHREALLSEFNLLMQNILTTHPQSVREVHELSTIVFKILTKP